LPIPERGKHSQSGRYEPEGYRLHLPNDRVLPPFYYLRAPGILTVLPMQPNELVLRCPFTVTSADTDMFGRIRLSALSNFLIQAAIQSADRLGLGFRSLREQELLWVLSRMHLEVLRPLRWYENLTVETWPKNVEKVFYIRDFRLRGDDGNVLALATSAWLAIDLKSRRPRLYNGLDAERLTRMKDRHALDFLPEKLKGTDGGDEFEFRTSYYDIDLNGHVTSTRYIDWMMDSFQPEFHRNSYPEKLIVNYLKETLPGDSIQMLRRQTGENIYVFEGKNAGKQTTAYRGEIAFVNK